MDETRPLQGPPPESRRDDVETATTTVTEPGPDTGPRVTGEQARDLDRLRRSATDRRLGGVCGGVARHLDVDPTVVRVVTAVLVLLGGAGLILYAGGWLFVPDERTSRAVVHLEGSTRFAALVVVGVLGALTALGRGFGPLGGGWWFLAPFPLLVLLVVGGVVWLSRRREGAPSAGPVPAPARVLPAYTPPRPRSGPILFWPTLAVVAVALGALGLYDASGGAVADGAYPALALAITGAALVLGAFWGRPGGLVLLALLSIAATALGVVVGTVPSGQRVVASPSSTAQVRSSYEIGNGTLSVDLTGVSDPQALDGRRIDLSARSGVVEVILPNGVGARVDADVDLAGAVRLPDGQSATGFAPHLSGTVDAAPSSPTGSAAGSPTVDLDVDTRLGAVYVRSQS